MVKLNRIYITDQMIFESLYKRSMEHKFTRSDLMRLHWDRRGKRAARWAQDRIEILLKAGSIERVPFNGMEEAPYFNPRRRWFRVSEAKLKEFDLYEEPSERPDDDGDQ